MRSTTVCHTQTLAFGGALMYHLQSTASVCSARLSADIWTDSTKPSGPLSSKSQAANANLQSTECLTDITNKSQMVTDDEVTKYPEFCTHPAEMVVLQGL